MNGLWFSCQFSRRETMKTKASVARTACPKAIAASLRTVCATELLPALLLWTMAGTVAE